MSRDPQPPTGPMNPYENRERRLYQRYARHGLMARIGQTLVEVDDISIGGIRLLGIHATEGTLLDMQLIPRDERKLDVSRAIWVKGHVLGYVGGMTRLKFASINYGFAKFIIHRLAQQNGLTPYIFK